VTPIEPSEPLAATGQFTVSGDDLFYLGGGSGAGAPASTELVVYRVTLP